MLPILVRAARRAGALHREAHPEATRGEPIARVLTRAADVAIHGWETAAREVRDGWAAPPPCAPRLLTREQAADYCGVSVPTFAAVCPVHPIAMGHGKRMERFDVQALDIWITGLRGAAPSAEVDWLERL